MAALGHALNNFIAVGESVVGEDIGGHGSVAVYRDVIVKSIFYRRDDDPQFGFRFAAIIAIADEIRHFRQSAVPVGDRGERPVTVLLHD
ncbi:hypothetical protein D3C75_1104300 [compost metagenome]